MKRSITPFKLYRCPILLALGLVALLASAGLGAGAAAHGPEVLIKSDPSDGAVLEESPPQVITWFSTELETGSSTLQVFDAEGRHVDKGDGGVDLNDPDHASMIVSLPTLPDGVYTVRWSALLFDGDVVNEEFTFSVGKSGSATSQISTTQTSSTSEGIDWPLDSIAASLGVLLLVVIGAFLYLRLARRG